MKGRNAMNDLIERLEKATGPDRRIDALIWMLEPCEPPDCIPQVRDTIFKRFMQGEQWGDSEVPFYTASIDAALTLKPQGVTYTICDYQRPPEVLALLHRKAANVVDTNQYSGKHPVAAIALCIAALKARAAPVGDKREAE